jgi:(2R)-sulfolactate sulfo-lyase subunit beta
VEGIPVGHKIALKDLKAGDTVMKYGEDIGRVVADIPRGAHVHVHNLKTKRWLSMQDLEFRGYRREDGRVGIRNHVVILPVDDISNAASDAVGRVIQGTLPLPHAYGRLQFGEDLELFFRTLIGVGSNPNVAAALVIGIEPGWTERVVQGIVKTGKPVMGFSIVRHGDLRTIAEVSRKAQEYVQWASELSTEECSMNEI